jgi:hypothetical protein
MPILSSTRGMVVGSLRLLTWPGTWSSAKPSPSSSLGAAKLSDGGARGLAEEPRGNCLGLGVVAGPDGASDMMKPASLGVAIVVGYILRTYSTKVPREIHTR